MGGEGFGDDTKRGATNGKKVGWLTGDSKLVIQT